MEPGLASANGDVEHYRQMLRNNGTMPPIASSTVDAGLKPAAKRKKNPQATSRFAEMNAFVDVTMAKLSRLEITTWLALFRFTDARVGTAQASAEAIAATSGASKQHTLKAIASLIEKRLLTRVKTGGINRGSSVYRVHPTGHP